MKQILFIYLLLSSLLIDAQLISTIAGNGTFGFSGDSGVATAAKIYDPGRVNLDAAGNLYISDTYNNRIRKVTVSTGIITTIAGNGTAGYSGDNGLATAAQLNHPYSVAIDASNNLYIADRNNNRVRKIDAVSGIITTIAGIGTGAYSGDGGFATAAELHYPVDVALDSSENILIADENNHVIRKVTFTNGIISTIAGIGTGAFSGDGGLATAAELYYPAGIALDDFDNIYIADELNGRIRKITKSTGLISTVAGISTTGYSGDNGLATNAELSNPTGVVVDASGNIYVADEVNNAIRKIESSTGIITTVAGNGTQGYNGDGILATAAELNNPTGVALDTAGNLYVADYVNNRIRMVKQNSATNINEEISQGNSIYVYPNPFVKSITVKSDKELGLASIYNSLGEIVYSEKIITKEHRIDVSKFLNGIYFLITENSSFKLIKE